MKQAQGSRLRGAARPGLDRGSIVQQLLPRPQAPRSPPVTARVPEAPSFPPGPAGARGRCPSRGGMQQAGGLSAPSPPRTPVASGSFTPSPTPPPCSSSSSSSSRCYGDSVPAPRRALRRSCPLGSPGGTEALCPAEGASGDGAVQRGLSGPATPGSASAAARPPSCFHLSLEPRGLPASGSTGRPPRFKGPAAPSPQRGRGAFTGGYAASTGGYAHLGSEPPSRSSRATPQTALHRTQHPLRAVPFQVAFGCAQEGHAWGLSRTVTAAQERRHQWQGQCLLASPPVTLGGRSPRDQRMLPGRGGEQQRGRQAGPGGSPTCAQRGPRGKQLLPLPSPGGTWGRAGPALSPKGCRWFYLFPLPCHTSLSDVKVKQLLSEWLLGLFRQR